jgi:hypothetical protein
VSQPLRSAEPEPHAAHAHPRIAELERRIAILEAEPDDRFGRFTRADWLVVWTIGVALPLQALWHFSR